MTRETANQSSPSRPRFSNRRRRAATALALAIAIATAGSLHAEVRVNGNAGAVQVAATRSNVAEVLSALENACGLRVKASIALDRAVSGTFTGSLTQVLSRVLQGYDYIIRREATEIEVTLIGLQGDRVAAAARPRPPMTPAMSLADSIRLKPH